MELYTQQLRLTPATRVETEALISGEAEEEMKAAYAQMLRGAIDHPTLWNWYAPWIARREDGTYVGDLCFKGIAPDGMTEIGYGIARQHQNQGYATEAVAALVQWASIQPHIRRIEAETEPDNAASQRVLFKCGFVPSGVMGKEGPRFVWNGGKR